MSTKHTPGELKRFETSVQFIQIGNKTIGHIGGTLNPEENEANAERIVLTWNTHDALLEGCKRLLAVVEAEHEACGTYKAHIAIAKQAIEKAEHGSR